MPMNSLRRARASRLTPLAAALSLCFSAAAPAATIAVNTDALANSAANCTLVNAIASINQGSLVGGTACVANGAFNNNDTVLLGSHTVVFDNTNTMVSSYALNLTKPMTIQGNVDATGAPQASIARSTLSGTHNFALIATSAGLSLIGLNLRNGYSISYGGAVGSYTGNGSPANLSISNCVVQDNSANGGGGIYASNADIVVSASTISGNTAISGGGGGGILSSSMLNSNTVSVTNSTISGNEATYVGTGGYGGGINAYKVVATNSTIAGNTSRSYGGGIYTQDLTANFSTLSGNSVPSGKHGGGLSIGTVSSAPQITLHASLLFGNSPGNDIDSPKPVSISSSDHNLIGTHGANVTLSGSPLTCDPGLSVLANNGGPTQTMALPAASCAIDVGPTSAGTITTDQRGAGYARKFASASDIGAYEWSDRIFYDGFGP